MSIYADTSFFVSLYVTDDHSAQAQKRLTGGSRPWLTPLHRAEWANAVAQHVFRREMTASQADTLAAEFDRDAKAGVWEIVDIPNSAFVSCVTLSRSRTVKLGTRTLDVLHVAIALSLGATHFWTYDARQRDLAKAEGLNVA